MPPGSTETGAPLIPGPREMYFSPPGNQLSRNLLPSNNFQRTTPTPFPRSFSRQVTMANSLLPLKKIASLVGRSLSRAHRLSLLQSVTSLTSPIASSTVWSLTTTLIIKPCSSSCSPESLGCEPFLFSWYPNGLSNLPFLPSPPLYEVGAEVWALDKFHGSFIPLRSELFAQNMQRRMSPIARLCGDLALLGDPVVLWNWKRRGPFFTMSSGNVHHSPTVSHFPICAWLWEHYLIATIILARQCSGRSACSEPLACCPPIAYPTVTNPAI